MADRSIAVNRKARHDYQILETVRAGIALSGTEVKSLRAGRANLKDGFARIKGGEAFLCNVHIAPYEFGNRSNHEPRRDRKLLLHRMEINRLMGKVSERGLTLIPLRFYFNRGWAKVELALARGMRQYDKREAIRKREAEREMARAIGRRAV